MIDESIKNELAFERNNLEIIVPKVGMEPIRKAALVKATIAEIGAAGSLDVTVSQIAKRAGVSSALAHHYFGGKEQILLAGMRHILSEFGAIVRGALAVSNGPKARVEAIIAASFEAGNFRREVISAWLNFYVQAQTSDDVARLLRVYQRRMHSNLVHGLKPLVGARADTVALGLASMIDGVYIREALQDKPTDVANASALVKGYLDMSLQEAAR